MTHIFISYSHQNRHYAHHLVEVLEKRGFQVWFDEHINYGLRWFKEITKAIRDSAAVLVIMTPEAEQSEWVEKEILLAKKHDKPIFPILLDGDGFDIFINEQYVDVRDDKPLSEKFFMRLAEHVPREAIQKQRLNLAVNTAAFGSLLQHDESRVQRQPRESMICTFYSYKGGLGRTMAAANVAEFFYRAGLNVLLVDWDLEAPGLETYFPHLEDTIANQRGILDLLLSYKRVMAESVVDASVPFESVEKLAIDIYPAGNGQLRLITAGQRSDLGSYYSTVRMFDVLDFYENWGGDTFFAWLRRQFLEIADIVLIDTRSGITEWSGIFLYQLPDLAILFCDPLQQTLDGTAHVLDNFNRFEAQVIGHTIDTLVIPSRVDSAEAELLTRFEQEFSTRFSKFTPNGVTGSFWDLRIPFISYYAYNPLHVTAKQPETARAGALLDAYQRIARAISQLSSENSKIHSAMLNQPQQ